MKQLLNNVAKRTTRYLDTLEQRSVVPSTAALNRLSELDFTLPDHPTDPFEIISLLDEVGSPATIASAGGRYFGFVIGGSLPASLAANWLAGAWDQNAGLVVSSPIGAKLEEVAIRWLIDVLALPEEIGGGLVTGATMANFSGLIAARHAILQRKGWDVESQGMFGAPPITVVVGGEVHVSVLKALSLSGFGRDRVFKVPVDGQGRMRVDALPELSDSTIVCIQSGNVNTGAFDPAEEICAAARDANAWVHVDGAFGLWAAASPHKSHLTSGLDQADSWAVDAHKWLNVPYDCGMVFCRNAKHLQAAMSTSASYLIEGERREPYHYTPEMSRRARGTEVWAALLSLGRSGLADLIERDCKFATRFANELSSAGYQVLNDVVLNQVLVSFGDEKNTRKIIAALQEDGTCFCAGTVWQGHTAMRISISSWATTEADIGRSIEAILRVAHVQINH